MSVETPPDASDAAPGEGQRLDAAQLAEAFEMFSRASEELSTAYNALQGQVAQLTERLAVLLGALPAGVVVLDRGGRVEQCNRAAETLLGGDLAGRPWDELATALNATETPGELTVGARRMSLSDATLESGEGRIILLHDVTDAHRMRLQAERNERLAAMGEMIAGLAHQLRTPLAAALLYTGNLKQPELAPADRARVADRAIERLRYLERLIRDMLLFARGDSLGRQRFGICDLAGELVHTLEPLARARQIAFSSSCDCGDATLLGDRKALSGAITNLLENAIQATEPGGAVDLSAVLEGGTVLFRIRDNGRGIELVHQARLFDPFFTTRADGTGLGLAIARGVARGHGGDIAVESSPGKGALFILSLPLPCPDEGDAAQAPKESS
ncbi:HAMP domain-containing sensor histidine kinase [Azoarcus sp. DN11]|uniref:sensor histidine kinase n=1 Tax=Azoarcus sp. DN11 TaxID=356837 RepID=UPI000EAFBCDB|nr:HAMP domain-containing sensor histidine kinase [Azoarcus sp. DN11]AYH43101.1 PAS domain-containing sensor histidine kinase [Azoarcus sp. DN11]